MSSGRRTLFAAVAVCTLAAAGAAGAVTYFQVEANPGGTKLFLDSAKDLSSSFGTVVNTDDIAISVSGNADFASGFSNIVPIKGGSLNDITFTPTNPDEFSDFSFRGQDLMAGQTIEVVVTDQNGNVQTIPFTEPSANADFARIGIVGMAGETIKSVVIENSGGFKEGKQFEFSLAAVPEPSTWALLIGGFGMVGGALRRRRTAPLTA